MSKKYQKVKDHYSKGLWSISRVRDAVEKSWITEEEFKEITGEEYYCLTIHPSKEEITTSRSAPR